MNYIVFDLEMNNKWGTSIHEIIEIGAVKIDSELKIVDNYQSFVKPKLYTTISKLIKKKTKIQQKWVDFAPELPYVMVDFRQWIGREDFVLCSWGTDDLLTFERNFKINEITEFGEQLLNSYYDIQKIFGKVYHLPNQISLKNALVMLHTEPKYDIWHRAIFDAINTAQVFIEIYDKIKTNPESRPKQTHALCLS